MKQHRFILATAMLLFLVLAGCGWNSPEKSTDYIGIDAAKTAALADCGVAMADASFSNAGLDLQNGTFFYDVEFTANGTNYRYSVDAKDGTVLKTNQQPDVSAPSNEVEPVLLSQDRAVEIAVQQAGWQSADVTSMETSYEHHGDRHAYQVQLSHHNGDSFQCEINAATGEVTHMKHHTEHHDHASSQTPNTILSEAEAIQLVLGRVPGSTAQTLSLTFDRDDHKYEGNLYFEAKKYEFELDAYSGAFLEWEMEPQ